MSLEDTVDEVGEPVIRALHLLTTDMLLADLISGRIIATSEGHSLSLASNHARSVLNWYRGNRSKWTGDVMAADCEAIVDSTSSLPPQLPVPDAVGATTTRRLRLVRIEAHRFAGPHAYGTETNAPADFVFEPEKPITLFEGWNGSGKTSLANVVIWCLTGQVLRPQRMPEPGDRDFDRLGWGPIHYYENMRFFACILRTGG
jgi:hypothetical protein